MAFNFDALGEKFKSLFKSKEDAKFQGQGHRLGSAQDPAATSAMAGPSPTTMPQPAAASVPAAQLTPVTAPTSTKQPSPSLPLPLPPARCAPSSPRHPSVVLDAALLANTPTGREAHLLAAVNGAAAPQQQLRQQHPQQQQAQRTGQEAGQQQQQRAEGRVAGAAVEQQQRGKRGRLAGGGIHIPEEGPVASTLSTPTAAERRLAGVLHVGVVPGGAAAAAVRPTHATAAAAPAAPAAAVTAAADGAVADVDSSQLSYDMQYWLSVILSTTTTSTTAVAAPVGAASATPAPALPCPSSSSEQPGALSEGHSAPTAAAAADSASPLDAGEQQQLQQQQREGQQETAPAAAGVAVPSPPPCPPCPSSSSSSSSSTSGLACLEALQRVLANVVAHPQEPKYRQIRLSNPRVQATLGSVPGAIELLGTAGFQLHFPPDHGSGSAEQGFLVLPDEAPLAPLQAALTLLAEVLTTHFAAAAVGGGGGGGPVGGGGGVQQHSLAGGASSGSATGTAAGGTAATGAATATAAACAPAAAAAGVAAVPEVERCTQVLLPATPDTEVPEWFFERTAAELKSQWAALQRRRQQQQTLATRAMRERREQEGGRQQQQEGREGQGEEEEGGGRVPAGVARVRVRFPEGVCLQGHFGASEPVSRIFHWVAASLRHPAMTFDLIQPNRKPLQLVTAAATTASTATATRGSLATPATARLGQAGGSSSGAGVSGNKQQLQQPLTVRGADLMPSVLLNLRPVGQEAAALAAANVPLLSDEMLRATRPQ
ncbi:hypothetical protein Agub_g13387 [Astrephomene gubernaculifera]|uniref:UBX domain-containing protein n=1 Tax=Astrephomene gubernaculifera TaxID=47775 RepID=A0AAD3HS24_9CHLO|nr:hypothetical protein Agub_g13387 [Astrephomene gubernaculifera]